jgi:hypothetical protein
MDHRTNGSTLWVAIYILDSGYGHVSLGRLALLLAIWLAAVCYSLEKARKQLTETTTESMDVFSLNLNSFAACPNFPVVFLIVSIKKRTHRRGAEGAESDKFAIRNSKSEI